MRQEARFLIGPLVGVVAVATLTACGSSDNDADPVLGPPTTEVTATIEVTATTEAAEAPTATAPSTTAAPTTTAPVVPVSTVAKPPVTSAPKPPVTAAPTPPLMSAQELESLEAELAAIDSILNELAQNFSAD